MMDISVFAHSYVFLFGNYNVILGIRISPCIGRIIQITVPFDHLIMVNMENTDFQWS